MDYTRWLVGHQDRFSSELNIAIDLEPIRYHLRTQTTPLMYAHKRLLSQILFDLAAGVITAVYRLRGVICRDIAC
jgi:hypothetical protein